MTTRSDRGLPHRGVFKQIQGDRSQVYERLNIGQLIYNALLDPSSSKLSTLSLTSYDLPPSESCPTPFPSSMQKSACKMNPAFCAFLLTALAASVTAHGFLYTLTIDGQRYKGNYPVLRNISDVDTPSAIRQVGDIIPVLGATNPALNCGRNATQAPLVANADPGSKLQFNCSGIDFQRVSLAAVLVVLIPLISPA